MFIKRNPIIIGLGVVVVLLLISYFVFINYKTKIPNKISASSATSLITTQTDWDMGDKDNIDSSSSSGSIKISDLGDGTKYDLSSGVVTSTPTTGNEANAIDGDFTTWWGPLFHAVPPLSSDYWSIDVGSEITVSKIKIKFASPTTVLFYGSHNGLNWDDLHHFTIEGTQELDLEATYRYWKVSIYCCLDQPYYDLGLYEFELYTSSATATHITGATQIDGGENFWSWDSNTITETVPANTSTSYQYRTSANGTDWTAWVGDIGSVTNRTGDDSNNPTRYRYLQIKATLSNTDGVSTPQVDSYDIDYHTEVKPNAPSAQTATVQ